MIPIAGLDADADPGEDRNRCSPPPAACRSQLGSLARFPIKGPIKWTAPVGNGLLSTGNAPWNPSIGGLHAVVESQRARSEPGQRRFGEA